jgi:predicted nucleic acid-binding protein
MNARAFLDTNILIYAFSESEPRTAIADELLSRGFIVSVQVLNEFVNVAFRKLNMPWKRVLDLLNAVNTLCPNPLPVTFKTHRKALQIVERYRYHMYDALIIASALESSCLTLYSEDMHNGQVIEGLTIRNPFRQALT